MDTDPNRYFNLIYNLRQRGRNIVTYVEEAEKLHRECPPSLQAFLPNQFVAGLDDESRITTVQIYLDRTDLITFPKAKEAVTKAYRVISRASPFDSYGEEQLTRPMITQENVNAGLLAFLSKMRVWSKAQKVEPVWWGKAAVYLFSLVHGQKLGCPKNKIGIGDADDPIKKM